MRRGAWKMGMEMKIFENNEYIFSSTCARHLKLTKIGLKCLNSSGMKPILFGNDGQISPGTVLYGVEESSLWQWVLPFSPDVYPAMYKGHRSLQGRVHVSFLDNHVLLLQQLLTGNITWKHAYCMRVIDPLDIKTPIPANDMQTITPAFSKSFWESRDIVAYIKLVQAGHFPCHIRHHVLTMSEKSDIMSDKVSHIKPALAGHFWFHVRHVPHIWRTLDDSPIWEVVKEMMFRIPLINQRLAFSRKSLKCDNKAIKSPRWVHSSSMKAMQLVVEIIARNPRTNQRPTSGGKSLKHDGVRLKEIWRSSRWVHCSNRKTIHQVIVEIMARNHLPRLAFVGISVQHNGMLIRSDGHYGEFTIPIWKQCNDFLQRREW